MRSVKLGVGTCVGGETTSEENSGRLAVPSEREVLPARFCCLSPLLGLGVPGEWEKLDNLGVLVNSTGSLRRIFDHMFAIFARILTPWKAFDSSANNHLPSRYFEVSTTSFWWRPTTTWR